MKPVAFVIVGAGDRGQCYARAIAAMPESAAVAGVVEPREFQRASLAAAYAIPPANVLTDWRELLDRERIADVAAICTQDDMHVEPAIALARKGYHILLEKPMAQNEPDCARVVSAIREAGVGLCVCHVLRYTDYTLRIRGMIEDGLIGDVVNVNRSETVSVGHFCHFYVRGRCNDTRYTPFLLAKCCHDIDWIQYIVGRPCEQVQSFGSLYEFRAERRPTGAAARCTECPIEAGCPYSAVRYHVGRVKAGRIWPTYTMTDELTEAGVMKALREGPQGRCVYDCENNVPDHQVVNMNFAGGATASYSVSAFDLHDTRRTTVFGTRGVIQGDERNITHDDFLTGKRTTFDAYANADCRVGGHRGADGRMIMEFIKQIRGDKDARMVTGPDETLMSHRIVFAAERSRMSGEVSALPAPRGEAR